MFGNFSSYLLYALLAALTGIAISQGQYRMASAWAALAALRWLMRDGQKYFQDSALRTVLGLLAALACLVWFLISVVIQYNRGGPFGL
jgi:apolipoprotein N-acyltransferase